MARGCDKANWPVLHDTIVTAAPNISDTRYTIYAPNSTNTPETTDRQDIADAQNANIMVAGIDEAGRGCLAGPVVAAAVILPAKYKITGLTDSKKLTPDKRILLADKIKHCALSIGLGLVWQHEIDTINILQATLKAMSLAAARLRIPPQILLIDGNKNIPDILLKNAGFKFLPAQKAIIDGDAKIQVISAASVIAKVFRDRLMGKLDKRYPGYGFAIHKGYGTKAHRNALFHLGPCKIHRLTFNGVNCKNNKEQCIKQKLLP